MSSDMFSSLVEQGACAIEKAVSYNEISYRKWETFSVKCKKRRYTTCIEDDGKCAMDKCSSWQIIEFIKYGNL